MSDLFAPAPLRPDRDRTCSRPDCQTSIAPADCTVRFRRVALGDRHLHLGTFRSYFGQGATFSSTSNKRCGTPEGHRGLGGRRGRSGALSRTVSARRSRRWRAACFFDTTLHRLRAWLRCEHAVRLSDGRLSLDMFDLPRRFVDVRPPCHGDCTPLGGHDAQRRREEIQRPSGSTPGGRSSESTADGYCLETSNRRSPSRRERNARALPGCRA